MRNIIKGRAVVADDWNLIKLAEGEDAAAVSVGANSIVPLAVWQAQPALRGRADVGVWLASDQRPEELREDAAALPLIAIDFPKFSDGRGYSIAYNLRMRLGFTGELRAVGDVLRDQLFYMWRVGFNAFEVRADRDVHDALKGLTDFSEPYQNSVELKAPLFARLQRSGAPA